MKTTIALVATYAALFVAGLVIATILTSCGEEARKDATTTGQHVDRSPADVLAMPNRFRNVATKCDGHGHRVYSNSTGNSGGASQIFVIEDAGCPGGAKK
jgi:hypothetical protein